MSFLKRATVVFSGIALCFFLSTFLAPLLLDRIEVLTGAPLPYEGALRLTIALAWLLFLLGWLWQLLSRGDYRGWMVFVAVSIAYCATLVVFFGDQTHRLMEEFSWIRYTTTLFLLCASLCAGALAHQQWREKKRSVGLLWGLLGGGLFFAGLDEVFELHEKIGAAIEAASGLPHTVTDYVTVAYAVGAAAVIAVSLRSFLAVYRERHMPSLFLLCLGAAFYFFSTLFDTFDVVVIKKLTALAKTLSADPSFFFSDPWYAIWSPKNFLNGLEEVFEQTAAMLFFSALLLILIDRHVLVLRSAPLSNGRRKMRALLALIGGGIMVGVAVIGFTPVSSPVVDASARVIAGPLDGLKHTDDLYYHQAWGIIVANEGKGNVYRWVDNRWLPVRDPNTIVTDTDSVTATKDSIYAASGSAGAIFEYTQKDGWKKRWDKKNGLVHPEALAVGKAGLYVLDEFQKTITLLSDDAEPVIWKPNHEDWRAPEGVVYDSKQDLLYITDDQSGALFEVDFGTSIRLITRLAQPEDIAQLPNGSFLISDNAWGAVFHVTRTGEVAKVVQFRRPYRDLQGIAVDEQGRLYVVTSDGFDSTSFMPSFLFRVDEYALR